MHPGSAVHRQEALHRVRDTRLPESISFPGRCAARSDALQSRGPDANSLYREMGPGSAEQREERCTASGTRESSQKRKREDAENVLPHRADLFAPLEFGEYIPTPPRATTKLF